MRHVFVINPKAGKGTFAENFSEIVKAKMESYGLPYELHVTSAPYEGIEFVRREAATGEPIRFYACGGDGTLYEVVNGAIGHQNAEVAVVPLGSGNDFIRLFGKKEELLDIGVHVHGTPTALDIIKCGDRYAINQCSMGLDAEVCAKQAHFKKASFLSGENAYTAALAYCALRKSNNVFTISIDDGEPFTMPVLFCFAGNSRWYGGGYMAGPKAIPDDGLLDFVILKKNKPLFLMVPLFGPYKRGEHLDFDITTFVRGKKIHIESPVPSAVNIDGETEYSKETTFEIIEKGMKYVVPSCSDYFERKKNGTL